MIKSIIAFFTQLVTVISLLLGIAGSTPYTPPVEAPDMDEPAKEVVEMLSVSDSGTSDYVIVKGANCTASESTAAQKLQGYLQQIGGVTLPIVTDDTPAAAHEIIIGKTNREGTDYAVDRAALGDEGVYIKTVGEKLVIAGGEKRGTLYAVYDFLEKYLDCHWYTKTLIDIPKAQSIRIPAEIDYTYVPALEFRDTDWISPKDTEYSLANHLNSTVYRRLDASVGGGLGYTSGMAHTLTTQFVASAKYFESHPEYYALHDGERTPNQLCLTNPDVLNIILSEISELLKNNPDASIISLTQHDNQDYCECDRCKALDEAQGSHSGTMITFVNAVADYFKEAYPNLAFDTFAYQYTRKPPKTVIPRDNVIVRLCSIECCFSHELNDPDCEQNKEFADDIKGWNKICDRLYIWDYTTNYRCYNALFPNFEVLQPNMKFFIENGVKGIYEEGNYQAERSNGEFAELRAYLLSKLLWNPDEDVEALTRSFCKAYYGEAAQYIMEYINISCYRAANHKLDKFIVPDKPAHIWIYVKTTDEEMQFYTKGDIEYIEKLWEKAKSADLTEEQLRHVQMSEICWRYWKACNQACEFSKWQTKKARLQVCQDLYDDMVAFDITQLQEGGAGNQLGTNVDLLKPPIQWIADKNK